MLWIWNDSMQDDADIPRMLVDGRRASVWPMKLAYCSSISKKEKKKGKKLMGRSVWVTQLKSRKEGGGGGEVKNAQTTGNKRKDNVIIRHQSEAVPVRASKRSWRRWGWPQPFRLSQFPNFEIKKLNKKGKEEEERKKEKEIYRREISTGKKLIIKRR